MVLNRKEIAEIKKVIIMIIIINILHTLIFICKNKIEYCFQMHGIYTEKKILKQFSFRNWK